MKKYVIFTGTVSGMGGGQMYTYNKQKYVQEMGYSPWIFVNRSDKLWITGFDESHIFTYEALSILPYLFSEKQVEKQVKLLLSNIQYSTDDEVVVESHTPIMALWAEIFAQKCDGRHLAFMIDEKYQIPHNYIDFFDFKLKRKELAGNAQSTVARIFEGYKEIVDSADYQLSPTCNNVVDDVHNSVVDALDKNTLTIACIGRLDKPYVPDLLEEFMKFAAEHKNERIQYVFIGGSDDKRKHRKIVQAFRGFKNVNCVVTGYLFPIPETLFEKVDIFIGAAGSASISWKYDVPTIALDINDYKPIGVLGYTAYKTLYREKEAEFSVSELLDLIIYHDYLQNMEYRKSKSPSDYHDVFLTHMEYISKFPAKKEYFSVMHIEPSSDEIKLVKLLGFLHTKLFIRIRNLIRKYKYH